MLKNMKINLTDTSKIATFVCIKKARPKSEGTEKVSRLD